MEKKNSDENVRFCIKGKYKIDFRNCFLIADFFGNFLRIIFMINSLECNGGCIKFHSDSMYYDLLTGFFLLFSRCICF